MSNNKLVKFSNINNFITYFDDNYDTFIELDYMLKDKYNGDIIKYYDYRFSKSVAIDTIIEDENIINENKYMYSQNIFKMKYHIYVKYGSFFTFDIDDIDDDQYQKIILYINTHKEFNDPLKRFSIKYRKLNYYLNKKDKKDKNLFDDVYITYDINNAIIQDIEDIIMNEKYILDENKDILCSKISKLKLNQ